MSNCTDKNTGAMLHAWELGLLDEKENEQFETHLIECEHCRSLAVKFVDAAKLMRNHPEFKAVVNEVDKEESSIDEKPVKRGRITRLVPTFAVAAVVLIVLLLKPWHIEIKPDLEAIAAQNKMAIMYFENMTDESDSGKVADIATNLLITDLSESQYMSVLSTQRLYDILKNMGMEGVKRINKNIALDIARETDAKWILFGSILQLSPKIIITTQMIKTETGEVTSSQKISGAQDDDIFAVIDKLTREIKNELVLPDEAIEESDPAVADVTSHSPEAYGLYIKGINALNMFFEREATELFNQAIALDSTFAMAYYQLSLINTSPSTTDYIKKALEYIDQASTSEKIYIQSRAAYLIDKDTQKAIDILKEGIKKYPDNKQIYYYVGVYSYFIRETEKAIPNLKKAIEIDPHYRAAINLLAYAYQRNQDYENAIITMNKYIEMVPNEPNPYDSRGDIYYMASNFEKAMESYEMALEIKPDFEASIQKLADLKLISRKYEEANELYGKLLNSEVYKYKKAAELGLLQINFYKGKLKGSLPVLDSLIKAKSKLESSQYNSELIALAYLQKVKIYDELGDTRTAMEQFDRFRDNYNKAFPEIEYPLGYYETYLSARLADTTSAKELIAKIKADNRDETAKDFKYNCAVGLYQYSQGHLDTAVSYLQKAIDSSFGYYPMYMKGIINFELGKFDSAYANLIYLTPLNYLNNGQAAIWTVKTYYYLGVIAEKNHDYKTAVYYLKLFLEYWDKADIEMKEVTDARARLDRIEKLMKE